jgi:hypothetical protein
MNRMKSLYGKREQFQKQSDMVPWTLDNTLLNKFNKTILYCSDTK